MSRSELLRTARFSAAFRVCCRICAVLIVLPVICGCRKSDRPTAPVSGAITLDGKPLAGGSIVSQPLAPQGSVIGGKGSAAFCDANGHFTLQTLDGQDGAVIGEHRVRIYGPRVQDATASDADARRNSAKEIVPAKYNHKTELTLTVPPDGTTEANFNLTKK